MQAQSWREEVAGHVRVLRGRSVKKRHGSLSALNDYLRTLELATDAEVARLVESDPSLAAAGGLAGHETGIADALDDWARSTEPGAALELRRRALSARTEELCTSWDGFSDAARWALDGGSEGATLEESWGLFRRQDWRLTGAAYVSMKLAGTMIRLFKAELSPEQMLEVLALYERGARLAGSHNSVSYALLERGKILKDTGRIDACERLFEEILTLHPGSRYVFDSELFLAEIARQRDRFDECLARLAALEARSGELSAARRLSIAELRGQTLLDQGLNDLASRIIRPAYQEATDWFAGLDDAGRGNGASSIIKARINARLGNLVMSTEEWERAEVQLTEILRDELTYARWPRMRTQMEIALGQAQSNLERADPTREPRARATIEAALATEDVRTRDRIDAELWLAKIALRDGELDESERLLALVGERLAAWSANEGGDEVSTETLEWVSWRARLALAREGGRDVLVPLLDEAESAMEGMLRRWSSAPRRPAGVGFMQYDHRRVLAGELTRLCVEALGRQEGAERALDWLVRIQARGTLFQESGLPAPDLAGCRALLRPEGHGALIYVPTGEGSHLFVLDRERLEYFPLAPGYEIEAARRAYLEVLRVPPSQRERRFASERERARALSDLLLPAEVQALIADWTRISVMGIDTLGVVPFACLPAFGAEHLGVVRAVDQMPSFTIGEIIARGIEARESSQAPTRDLFLVAGVLPGGEYTGLAPLPFPASVRERLVAPWGGGRVRVVAGPRATPRAVERAGLEDARIFQPLVHGVVDFSRERPGGLALSAAGGDDGVLWCPDVEGLDAPRFVLLASCRSGRERTRRGDAVAGGMGGAWIAAGAQAVLVSYADLDYEDAIELSAALHERLARRGADPAEALRDARAERFAALGTEAVFRLGLIDVVGLGHASLYADGEEVPDPASDVEEASAVRSGVTSLGLLVGAGGLFIGLVLGFVLGARPRRA